MPNDGDNQTVFTIAPGQLRIDIQALSDTGQCATYHQLFANSDAAKDYRILISAPQGIDDDDKYLFRKGSEGKYIYYRHSTQPQPSISFDLKGLCAVNFFKGLIESEATQFYGGLGKIGDRVFHRDVMPAEIFSHFVILDVISADYCSLTASRGTSLACNTQFVTGCASGVLDIPQYCNRGGAQAMAYRVNATCEQLGGSGGLVFGLMNPIPAGMEVEVAYANHMTLLNDVKNYALNTNESTAMISYSSGEDTFWSPSSARGIGTTLAALLVITLSMP
ncbi:unnamed protein product, partial [Mesorhabditis spiculigera]